MNNLSKRTTSRSDQSVLIMVNAAASDTVSVRRVGTKALFPLHLAAEKTVGVA